MEKLEWKQSFNTGIAEIDNQHHEIVDYLDQLRESRLAGDIKATGDVLNGMVDYTLSHFAFEEALMAQVNYPYASAHKSVHDTFVKRVSQFKGRFEDGEDVTEELYGLLRRWLINHIQRDDMAYVRPVKAHLDTLAGDTPAEGAPQNAETKGWFSRALSKFFG